MSNEHSYREYIIRDDPPPIPFRGCDFQFWHVDYDGPEDSRCGCAVSLEAAKLMIDEIEGEGEGAETT